MMKVRAKCALLFSLGRTWNLYVVWIIHNAENVTERVRYISSDKSRFTTTCEWFIFFRNHCLYLFVLLPHRRRGSILMHLQDRPPHPLGAYLLSMMPNSCW